MHYEFKPPRRYKHRIKVKYYNKRVEIIMCDKYMLNEKGSVFIVYAEHPFNNELGNVLMPKRYIHLALVESINDTYVPEK